jgi:ATP-dependent DNA helicase RecQ
VLRGEQRIRLRRERPTKSSRRREARDTGGVEDPLFEALRAERMRIAREQGVPPYVVFHDTTLRELARVKPRTIDALRHVYGVGARKADDLGPAVLEVIAAV